MVLLMGCMCIRVCFGSRPKLEITAGMLSLCRQGTIETWMLLEYADRGSLEEAIAQKRFRRKSDRSQTDLVRQYLENKPNSLTSANIQTSTLPFHLGKITRI